MTVSLVSIIQIELTEGHGRMNVWLILRGMAGTSKVRFLLRDDISYIDLLFEEPDLGG